MIEKLLAGILVRVLQWIATSSWELGKDIITKHQMHSKVDEKVKALEKEVLDPSLSPTQLKRIKDAGRALIRSYNDYPNKL